MSKTGSALSRADTHQAVEIADRVWWVGHMLADDSFQCHTYLIEQGDQSVLIDPGSRLTFLATLRKIESILPLDHIRYFVCHHPDPDIAAAFPLIDTLVSRNDAVVVTHWRSQALLKHYDLSLPFWLVDEHDWRLPLADRDLRFIFTPYAHFPGAICSFDTKTGTLFSSDLFGGFTDQPTLVAADESHFEALRPFHEHYIPGREILEYALAQIERHPVALIAPQHGSIIPPHLVGPIIHQLRQLECGIYLFAQDDTDIQRLSRLNRTLSDITQTLLLHRDFREIAVRLFEVVSNSLPVERIDYYAWLDDGKILVLSSETRFIGLFDAPVPDDLVAILGKGRDDWDRAHTQDPRLADHQRHHGPFCSHRAASGESVLTVPLFARDSNRVVAAAAIRLHTAIAITREIERLITQLAMPLQVAIEREVLYRAIDEERDKAYQRSIRDSLTGLFNRFYMQDVVQRQCAIHDRDAGSPLAALFLDLDHFKAINDRYGHTVGDEVLRQVASVIREQGRETDVPVRYGGEEFVIFLMGSSALEAGPAGERLRQIFAAAPFAIGDKQIRVTASIGVALRRQRESLEALLRRADEALYRAKTAGRNRLEIADEPLRP